MNIPHYLEIKLAPLKLNNESLLRRYGYLEIFAELRLSYPSLGYQALFDLFALCQGCSSYSLSNELKQSLIASYKALPPHYPLLDDGIIANYLHQAEMQAKIALSLAEIPIGAVIVLNNKVIGRGYNRTRSDNDILQHAEIVAIRDAQCYLGNHRLNDCDLYVTVEPCLMCAGAIINSRIRRIIFGATEPKTGACCSQFRVFDNKKTNHHCQVIGPINNDYYSQMIKQFLRKRSP